MSRNGFVAVTVSQGRIKLDFRYVVHVRKCYTRQRLLELQLFRNCATKLRGKLQEKWTCITEPQLTRAAGKIYIVHTRHFGLRAQQHFLTESQVQSI